MKTINGTILLRKILPSTRGGGILLPTPNTELVECRVAYNAYDYGQRDEGSKPTYYANSKVYVRASTQSQGTLGDADLYRIGDIIAEG